MAYHNRYANISQDDMSRDVEMSEPRSAHARHSSLSAPNTPGTLGEQDIFSDTQPLWGSQRQSSSPLSARIPSLAKTLLVQTFAFLWLVPITTLLYLNLKKHIIGASAWCPFGNCYPKVWVNDDVDDIEAIPALFDKQTHNLLGMLQVVSKLLEIWFILIATWLVYLRTMRLAGQTAGIPIGYLTRPSEFADLPSLFDRLLWKTLGRVPSTQPITRRRLWRFIVMTIALCILCNLIGPGVAVLLIPSLQWRDTDHVQLERLVKTDAGSPLSGPRWASAFDRELCYYPENVTAMKYSCYSEGAATMDAWVETSKSSEYTNKWITIQDEIQFSFNASFYYYNWDEDGDVQYNELAAWVPSRQVMAGLNKDLYLVRAISQGAELDEDPPGRVNAFRSLNSTLQGYVQRRAPVLGAIVTAWAGFGNADHWDITVDKSRAIRCYRNYNISATPTCWEPGCYLKPSYKNYTRCISIGDGWGIGNGMTNFSVVSINYVDLGWFAPNLTINVYTSSRVTFLDQGRPPPGVSADCLVNGTAPSTCDWDSFFEKRERLTWQRYGPATTIEVSRDIEADEGMPSSQMLAIDFNALQSAAIYTLDVSRTNHFTTSSFLLDGENDWNPISVDPNWVAAAWSADVGGRMSSARTLTLRLESAMDGYERGMTSSEFLYSRRYEIDSISIIPIMQTLSLINFETTNDTAKVHDKNLDQDPQTPLLYVWGRMNVYAYGLSTRTAYFGCIVVIIGCLVVLLEVYTGLFVDRRAFTSPTDLVVAALTHPYQDEFKGATGRDKMIWRTKFRVREDASKLGRLGFEKTV